MATTGQKLPYCVSTQGALPAGFFKKAIPLFLFFLLLGPENGHSEETGSFHPDSIKVQRTVPKEGKTTTQTGTINPAMELWEQAVADETKRAVASGERDVNTIRAMVSTSTAPLEHEAREAHIQLALAMGAIAFAAQNEGADPEMRELLQRSQAQLETIQREQAARQFQVKKNRLIEKHFREAVRLEEPGTADE